MKPALLLGMVTGWLGLLMTLAMPSVAQTPPLYVACVTTTPSSSPPPTITPAASPTLNDIFKTATALAVAPLPSPTIEIWATPTIAQARYRVDSIAGVNVRSAPSLSAGIVSSLRQGDVVIVTEMSQYVDGWVWGRVTGGWVAMRSINGAALLRAVP